MVLTEDEKLQCTQGLSLVEECWGRVGALRGECSFRRWVGVGWGGRCQEGPHGRAAINKEETLKSGLSSVHADGFTSYFPRSVTKPIPQLLSMSLSEVLSGHLSSLLWVGS